MLNLMQMLTFALWEHVRFGSKADICGAKSDVRFTPNSDRKSGHAAMVMSALHLKADMCGANRHVCFGPIADIGFAQLFQCACRPKMRNCRDKQQKRGNRRDQAVNTKRVDKCDLQIGKID